MSTRRTYLDWNATAPLRPEARVAILAALDEHGNPSSVHAEGRKARAITERARYQIAALAGAEPHNVIFTSGATEAANQALVPRWSGGTACALYAGALEHPCVLAGGRFQTDSVITVAATKHGVIDIDRLKHHLGRHDLALGRPLVALMLANNETGVVQPVAEAAALVHDVGGLLICDAVQAAGRIPVDLRALGADAILLSAHKLGGPKGVGALVLADEAVAPAPLMSGGGQERRQRAGTENVAGIAGFGAAAEAALAELARMPAVARLRDRLERGLAAIAATAPWQRPDGGRLPLDVLSQAPRLPNTTLATLPGATAETLVIQLDLAGIAVSAGAACSSGKLTRSHVLNAMGIEPEIAAGTIRVSLGATNTDDDIDRFLAAWSEIAARHGARKAA